ncbi:hypothetical protein BYI23_B000480 [Burkholderia sp. YI23]|nr:hypothetical protein BYI23_B000480 [Burkholderia sp. YI23]
MKISNRYQKAFEQAKETPAYWAEGAMLDIARQIVAVMRDKGISQAKLAEMMGKHAPFISRVLSGEHNVTIQTIAEAVHALDAHLDVRIVPNKAISLPITEFTATVDHAAMTPSHGIGFRSLKLVKLHAMNQTAQEQNFFKKVA